MLAVFIKTGVNTRKLPPHIEKFDFYVGNLNIYIYNFVVLQKERKNNVTTKVLESEKKARRTP